MRVYFLGNTCNNHYSICKFLRRMGVDAHVFYDGQQDPQTFPHSEDPEIALQAPSWIHPLSAAQVTDKPYLGPSAELLEQLKEADIIQAEDFGLIWAAQTGKPYIWYPYGFDINFYSFSTHWRKLWSREHWEYFFAPTAFRRAVSGASAVVAGIWDRNLAHGYNIVRDLLPPEKFIHKMWLAIDTDVYCPGTGNKDTQALISELGIDFKVEGLVLFHPTRIMFTPKSYVSKANDRLYCALARLKAAGRPFTLVLVRKGNPDEPDAEALIKQLGIEDRTVWIPKLTRRDLVPWYRAADITPDEFISGSLGSISIETMGCGTPQMTYLRTNLQHESYWPLTEPFSKVPPLINVITEDEIFNALLHYSDHPEALKALGEESRRWVVENVSGPVVARRFLELYTRTLEERQGCAGASRPFPLKQLPDAAQVLNTQLVAANEFLQKGQAEAALGALSDGLDKLYYERTLCLALLEILMALGWEKEAQASFKQLSAVAPEDKELAGAWQAVLARYSVKKPAPVAESSGANLAALIQAAQAHLARGDAESAKASLRAAIDLQPASEDLRIIYGRLLVQTGESAQALEQFTVVTRQNPQHTEAREMLALTLWLAGRSSDCEKLCREVLATAGRSAQAMALLGRCYSERKEHDAARLLFAQALEIAPDNAIAKEGLAALSNASKVAETVC